MQKKRIAIVGYGQFGKFMAKQLRPYATIVPIRRDTDPARVSRCDVVVFAVPWSSHETVAKLLQPHVSSDARIIDVMSVKEKPLQILKSYYPNHEILGTHPIFGPQSGKHGVAGLPIVLCNVSFSKERYAKIKRFLKQELQLKVIEQTPKQHDQDMAEVQGITHFIGRAITAMQVKSRATNTKSYEQLLQLIDLVGGDSWELFKTIQNTNPQAKRVRKRFLAELADLETRLDREHL